MPNGNRATLKDTYEVMQRLEDKMDKRMCAIENRVDILEDFKGKILGVAAVISAVSGAIFSWLWEKVTKRV
jgi:hypothetical protein